MEINWPKIGNDKITKYLETLLSKNNVTGTYIFLGPDDLGKSTIALAFARHLLGLSKDDDSQLKIDLQIIEPEPNKKIIGIDQVREMISQLSLSSFLDKYKVAIIKQAELLNQEAQNALLKILEEPEDKVVIILLSNDENKLLPTILSRGQKLYFQPVATELIYDYLLQEYGAKRKQALDLAKLSLGRPLRAVDFLEDGEAYKNYELRARVLLQTISQDLNQRLAGLEEIFADKSYSAQAQHLALELIGIYEGLWRDLLLLSYNLNERVQHSFLQAELEQTLVWLKKNKPASELIPTLLSYFKLGALARDYLANNVKPFTVLEQLLINL